MSWFVENPSALVETLRSVEGLRLRVAREAGVSAEAVTLRFAEQHLSISVRRNPDDPPREPRTLGDLEPEARGGVVSFGIAKRVALDDADAAAVTFTHATRNLRERV